MGSEGGSSGAVVAGQKRLGWISFLMFDWTWAAAGVAILFLQDVAGRSDRIGDN